MSLIVKLQKIYANFFSDNLAKNLDYRKLDGLREINQFISSLPEPRDDIERSYNQYLGTVKHLSLIRKALLNTASLILVPVYLAKLLYPRKMIDAVIDCDAIFFVADHISPAIIPDSLKEEFRSIIKVNPESGCSLDDDGRKYFCRIVSATFGHPYYHLKALIKIGFASDVLRRYRTKALIHNTETSFAASLVTRYCELKGVDCIGVMHGEFFANYKSSFFRCTRFYVWDEYYRKLLVSERCEPRQFRIEQPDCIKLPDYDDTLEKRYDLTYYLQNESEEELTRLLGILNYLKNRGQRISIRIHPKYHSKEMFEQVFQGDWLECLESCSLGQSLSRTRLAVAKCSTVLYQAYLLDVPVMIDDIADPKFYSYLKKINYHMLFKDHRLLSQYLREVKNG